MYEDEISPQQLIKEIINSKTLILLITLSIASITFFYEYQKTPIYNNIALIEIGHNYSLNDDLFYEQKYIESIEQLIVNLKLNFLRKPNKDNKVQNVAFKKISENILSLQAQSLSIDDGNYFINSIIDTTIDRHKKLMIQLTDYSKVKEDASKSMITTKIKNLDNEMEYKNGLEAINYQQRKLQILYEIEILNIEIPFFLTKIEQLENIIKQDEAILKLISSDDSLYLKRAAQNPSMNQVLFEYHTSKLKYEEELALSNFQKTVLEKRLETLNIKKTPSPELFSQEQARIMLQNQLNLFLIRPLKSSTNTSLLQEVKSSIDSQSNFKVFNIFISFLGGLFLSIFIIFTKLFFRNDNFIQG